MTFVDFEPYLAGFRARHERERAALQDARERALGIAGKLAGVLVSRYGARRVLLVGSLARGDFGRGSDIDLVAEGLPDEVFFKAGADIEALAEGLSVDLVPLESATPAYREQLAEEGLVLA